MKKPASKASRPKKAAPKRPMTAKAVKKAYRKKEAMEGPEKGESLMERKMLKKGGVVKKQTGGKLPMRKPGVTKENPRLRGSVNELNIKQGYTLADDRDMPGDDFELWRKGNQTGYYRAETGECMDMNGKRVPCPGMLQKKRTGGKTKRCPKCGMTKCKC